MGRAGRSIWAAAAAAAAAVLCGCHDGNYGNAPASFRSSPGALDFGPTALGVPKAIELQLQNAGSAPYRVYSVSSSVANVTVSFDQPFDVGPGEGHPVVVQYAPDVEGDLSGALELQTDADQGGNRGKATVLLRGRGVKAYAQPSVQRVDFGNIELNTTVAKDLSLSNATAADVPVRVTIEGADFDEYTSAQADRTFTIDAGGHASVTFAFKPTRLGAADAIAKLWPCPGCEAVQIPLSGTGIASLLDISPLIVSFGRVAVGAAATQTVTVRNLGNTSMDYFGAAILDDGGGVFQVTRAPSLPNDSLPAGASVSVDVSFSPTAFVTSRGLLQIRVGAAGVPGPKLALMGQGGSACVVPVPSHVDFGTVPPGMTSSQYVDLSNRCPEPVDVSSLQLNTLTGGYFWLAQAGAYYTVPSGGTQRVWLNYRPKLGSTTSTGTLTFNATDAEGMSAGRVDLAGATADFPPCVYRIDPGALDFLNVPIGASATEAVTLINIGTTACFVASIQLTGGSDPEFFAVPLASQILQPGQKVVFPVTFHPISTGTYTAMIEGYVNSSTAGHPMVTVTGQGVDGCFSLQPTNVDFGLARAACGAKAAVVMAYNRCPSSVTIQSISLSSVTTEMALVTPPATPLVVAPGQNAAVTVQYQPVDDGPDAATLAVVTAEQGSFSAGINGSGTTRTDNTDQFIQDVRGKVDVLFVVDNSGSMTEEQTSLSRNFAAFMTAAQALGVDYHIGVTTTGLEPSPGGWTQCPGGAQGGENGRLFPVDNSTPRIITPDTPDAASVFATNVQVGICHWNERGLGAAYRALSAPLVNSADDPTTALPNDGNLGFLRDDAKLAIIFISDEDDSSDQTVDFYESFLLGVKNGDRGMLAISAIVGPLDLSTCPTASGSGTRYISLTQKLGGIVESICTPDWAASLTNLSSNAFGARRQFPLSAAPADPAQIRVFVSGAQVTAGWAYDAGSNSVIFSDGSAPPPGSTIEINYPVAC